MMKKVLGAVLVVCAVLSLSGCKSSMHVSQVDGWMIPVDSTWDSKQDQMVLDLIVPYKNSIDSVMNKKLGESEMMMSNSRPEDLLQNLVADVLRDAASTVLGCRADVGLMNIGGLRNVLPAGDVTLGNVFEILPFENALCVMELDGATMKKLMAAIANRGGEGISGAKIVMDARRNLLECWVDGKPFEDDKIYTLATIDYLAGGNDGMTPLLKAKSAVYPDNCVLRDIFVDYVMKKQTAGEKLTSKIEGRIVVR